MTLDTNDLHAVFETHAADVTVVPDFAGPAATRGRRAQRRRAVGGVVGVAIVVAGVFGLLQVGLGAHRSATPAGTTYGLDEYSQGMRLVTAHEGGTPSGLDFDVTLPASADGKPTGLGLSLSCAAPKPGQIVNVAINGVRVGGTGPCGTTLPKSAGVMTSWPASVQPIASGSTIHVHVTWSDGKPRAGSQFLVGVYVPIPVNQYVYPPRPVHLTPADSQQEMSGPDEGASLGSLSSSTRSLVVRPQHGLTFVLQTTEPGYLQVYVNGKREFSARSWVYTPYSTVGSIVSLAQLGISAGDPVTLTVVTTGYTGDTWRVFADDKTP
jgi:hypothetical protein